MGVVKLTVGAGGAGASVGEKATGVTVGSAVMVKLGVGAGSVGVSVNETAAGVRVGSAGRVERGVGNGTVLMIALGGSVSSIGAVGSV